MALDLGNLSARMTLDNTQYLSALNKANIQTSQSIAEIKGLILQAFGVAGVTGLFLKASSAAMNFSSELANVASIANDLNIEKIKKGILELNSVYGSSIDLTRAFYQTYSAGIRGTEDELVKFTGQVSSLSKTILSDQATTVESVTKIMNAYGISVSNVGEVLDTLFQIVKLGQTTGPELAVSIGQVVNSAVIAKLSLNELGAAIATLTRTMPTSVAITSLNHAILAFIQPTKEAIETAKKYGIELSASALQQKGFAKAIAEINEKAGDNIEALALMFGSVRSFRAVASLASNQASEFQDILSQFQNKGGSQLEAFERATNNLKKTWTSSMIEMEKAFINLGDALAPAITSISSLISGVSSTLKGLGEGEIQTGLLSAAFLYLSSKIKTVIASKAQLTQATIKDTAATMENSMAQKVNAESFSYFSKTISNTGTYYKYNIVSMKEQKNVLTALTGGFSGAAGAMTALLNVYIAFETGRIVFNLTKSFMENTEAGQKLTESLSDLIFKLGELSGTYDDIISESKEMDEQVLKSQKETMERWMESLSGTEFSDSAKIIYEQYLNALKSGNVTAQKEAREEMAKLIRQTRISIKEEVENLPEYKLEIQDVINIGGVKGDVAKRLASLTEQEFLEFKKIAKERFGVESLFSISPDDYEKIFNISDFKKAYENEIEIFKKMSEDFEKELQAISIQGVIQGRPEEIMRMDEEEILLRQRERIIEEMKRLEADRVEASKRGMEDETKFIMDALSKRLELYKTIEGKLSEIRSEELTSEDIISKQVREAGGLKNIREKILSADVGGEYKVETVQKYVSTLDKEQRAQFQGLVEQFKGKGADVRTAETNAIIVMQRNIEKQAKINEANSREMVDLLQQLNDYFKSGNTLILTAP